MLSGDLNRSCNISMSNGKFRQKVASMANPVQFIQQVRSEMAKVTWPTRREVVLTTTMVLIMSALTAVFFWLVDLVIRTGLVQVIEWVGGN